MEAPEHSRYLHWGATSQDIMDTGLALTPAPGVRPVGSAARRSGATAGPSCGTACRSPDGRAHLWAGGDAHQLWRGGRRMGPSYPAPPGRGCKMCGRRSSWYRWAGQLGTLAAMGPEGPAIRAALARTLGLVDPGHSWHPERDGTGALRRLDGGNCSKPRQNGRGSDPDVTKRDRRSHHRRCRRIPNHAAKAKPRGTFRIGGTGSTGDCAGRRGAKAQAIHRQSRDGAAWVCGMAFGAADVHPHGARPWARAWICHTDIAPDAEAMARGWMTAQGLIRAEELTFALARVMPRPEAQAQVKAICAKAQPGGPSLADLVGRCLSFPCHCSRWRAGHGACRCPRLRCIGWSP